MQSILQDVIQRAGTLLQGPFGGVVGGVISFLLLEIGIKKARDRHGIADALAAELTNNADHMQTFLDDMDTTQIPQYYRTSNVVFKSLVGRLGELPYQDVIEVTKLYGFLDEYNRLPAAWMERASHAYSLPMNHPLKEEEFKAVQRGAALFYDKLLILTKDCRGLATHLRTRHVLGLRSLIPARWRPKVSGQVATTPKKKAAA